MPLGIDVAVDGIALARRAMGGTETSGSLHLSSIRVNVMDAGARGDGVTDDTAAIQAAINAVQAAIAVNSLNKNEFYGSGVVYLPTGNYRITQPLVIMGSGVMLAGDGDGATLLLPTAGTGAIVVGDGTTANRPLGVRLSSFRVSYNDQFPASVIGIMSPVNADTKAIAFQTADLITVDRVSVFFDINNTVTGLRGFDFNDCEIVGMYRCAVHECGGAAAGTESVALHITNSAQNHGNFQVDSFYARKVQVGVKLDSTNLLNSLVFTNLKVVNASMGAGNSPKYGVWIGGNVTNVTFDAPHIEGQSGKFFASLFYFDTSAAQVGPVIIISPYLSRGTTVYDMGLATNPIVGVQIFETLVTGGGGDTITTVFSIGASVAACRFIGARRITAPVTTWLSDASVAGSRNEFRWRASSAVADIQEQLYKGNSGILSGRVYAGSGSPAGVVVANVGDIFMRSDGGAGTSFYVKESGSGTSAGWVAK